MFKKIAMIVLFATVFGAFSLNAAPSKAEVQKMFKTMISKKWNREFFQPAVVPLYSKQHATVVCVLS